jgi:hypothetical protein
MAFIPLRRPETLRTPPGCAGLLPRRSLVLCVGLLLGLPGLLHGVPGLPGLLHGVPGLPGVPGPGAPALPGLALADDAGRCSIHFTWGPSLRPDVVYLLGTATGDSVAASLAGRQPADFDPAGPGIRGQIVRVHGSLSVDPRLAAAVPPGSDAVVVWWAYDQMCRTQVWDSSILHARPGVENVFAATLREPAEWVGGMPTVDIRTPYHLPWPGVEHRREDFHAERGLPAPAERPLLTGGELFDFLGRLPAEPGRSLVAGWPYTAAETEAVLDWARDHPDRWEAEPVRGLVRRARDSRQMRDDAGPHPVLGIYQLRMQHGEVAGDLCIELLPAELQSQPADYDSYAGPPWRAGPPAMDAFSFRYARSCDSLAAQGRHFAVPAVWIAAQADDAPPPGALRSWRAALAPGPLRHAVITAQFDGVRPPEPDAAELDLTVAEWQAMAQILSTARFVEYANGAITLEERRGPARYPFAVHAHRVAR